MPAKIEDRLSVIDIICEQLVNGRSLIGICKDEGMPCYNTVYNWIRSDEEVCTRIAHAREGQADYFLDKQIEFTETATVEDYQLRKFQADNLKWVAAKLRPLKYGENKSLEVNHKGAVGLITADLSGLCGLLTELASNRASAEIQGDVLDGSLLPAPVRPE